MCFNKNNFKHMTHNNDYLNTPLLLFERIILMSRRFCSFRFCFFLKTPLANRGMHGHNHIVYNTLRQRFHDPSLKAMKPKGGYDGFGLSDPTNGQFHV
mmetsp:Transcript_17619/g.35089  ORF Transcript_17619/g.35089 Transcript_17619/m.35089 type:complete len:98 (-) Transcript_17619:919-1212(-)